MGRERFKEQGTDSFFGRLVYDRIVPEDHFFRKLNEIIPWERFTRNLVKYYRGKARIGRPPYDPALLLKMLLVAYLYDLSARQTPTLDPPSRQERGLESLATSSSYWHLRL